MAEYKDLEYINIEIQGQDPFENNLNNDHGISSPCFQDELFE